MAGSAERLFRQVPLQTHSAVGSPGRCRGCRLAVYSRRAFRAYSASSSFSVFSVRRDSRMLYAMVASTVRAADGDAQAGSQARERQEVRAYQDGAEAEGADAEQDRAGRGDATGCRFERRRTGACLHGCEIASGPSVFDGEDGQRERYDQQARPGRYQEDRPDSEDHYSGDGDRDPAEQPYPVLHLSKHASGRMTI